MSETEEFINEEAETKTFKLSRCHRIFIFVILMLSQLFINTSSGILSSGSTAIKAQLGFNNKQFGLFGSLFGFGRMLGGVLFMTLVSSVNRKYLLFTAVCSKSILLLMIKFTNEGKILLALRGLIGVAHMIITVYIPIWIDQFGIKNKKLLLMSVLHLSIPVGKVSGNLLNILYGEENWQNGFFTEGIYFVFTSLVILLTPERFFSSRVTSVLEPIDSSTNESRVSLFQETVTENEAPSVLNCFNFLTALKNPVFIFSSLIRVTLMGVNTAFQYWINDYIRNALNVSNPKIAFSFYTTINILGAFGGIFANALLTKLFGSYESKKSSYGVLLFHIITCVFGMMIPFAWDLYSFGAVTILFLFFNSAVLPVVQGIIINSVSNEIRGSAFAFVNLFTMIVTSGPLPFIYGAVNDMYKDTRKNMGMIVIMGIENIAIVFILLMTYYRKKGKEGAYVKQNINEGIELKESDSSESSKV